jgi:hypothetical protein
MVHRFFTLRGLTQLKAAAALLALSLVAIAIHGYHPYAEDAEIYLPSVERALQPDLFPVGTEFFESHASLSFFPNLIALSVRMTRLPLPYALLAWHVASVFLLLLASWELCKRFFKSPQAKVGAVLLVAALLTLPVAGTALYIMDQYPNTRNLAAFAVVLAVARMLEQKYARAAAWLVFAAAMHPLMAVFAVSLCVLVPVLKKMETSGAIALAPLSGFFFSPSPAYHEAAQFHGFHYMLNWHWYELLGIIGPIALFVWFRRIAESRGLREMALTCRGLVIYDLVYFAAALVVSVPKRFETLARIQPMRSLHLLYILLLIMSGGLIAEYVLKKSVLRWIAFYLPLAAGMFVAQRALFPASAHLEWPWARPKNDWAQAFVWIQKNTPKSAIFAVDPSYMLIPDEDKIGFRALAQRSRLADVLKDSGTVSMFPDVAEEWWKQLQAQQNWSQLTETDFRRLKQEYGVSWVVLQPRNLGNLPCPYQNRAVLVCQIEN